jgi:hypothetical protein
MKHWLGDKAAQQPMQFYIHLVDDKCDEVFASEAAVYF